MTYVKAIPSSLGLAVGVQSRLHTVKDVLRELARIFDAPRQGGGLPHLAGSGDPPPVGRPPAAAPPRPADYDPFVPNSV